MIKITKLTTRPNTNVLWHFDAGFYSHMNDTYVQPGKCILSSNAFSEDGLQMTWTSFWDTEENYNAYQADPLFTVYWNLKQEYYDTNGVVMSANQIEPA